MTAEIAVLNSIAVAIAADSAVTIGNNKIFNTSNKLFSLSKYQPVGIMIYGAADLINVPWELIIKQYRKKLKRRTFNTLLEYGEDFINHLDNNELYFPDETQNRYIYTSSLDYFREVIADTNSAIKEKVKFKESDLPIILEDIVEKHFNVINGYKNLPYLPNTHYNDILSKYDAIIDKAIKDSFKDLSIFEDVNKKLKINICNILSKNKFSSKSTGVVLAGYGENEIFPKVVSFNVEGVANKRLKYRLEVNDGIGTNENRAGIITFAQKEMVQIFMDGIDPLYKDLTNYVMKEIIRSFSENAVKLLNVRNKSEKGEQLMNMGMQLLSEADKYLNRYRKDNHVDPVVAAVSVLPKDELAVMAETLVNLTSFKRKMSLDSETVGGPIDVAVISKVDGFVWIKRKLYFDLEKNPYYYNNYYKEYEE